MTIEKKRGCENLDQLVARAPLDDSLLETLADCLSADVRRFVISRCGDQTGDADDIHQDAMLAAQRYLSSFRGEASLRTWMYKLVLSACSRRRRGHKNDPKLHLPYEELPEAASPSDPELAVLMSERLTALDRALSALRPEDRELLAAVEWEERSLGEVAVRYGLTVPAMKSRMFRIRQKLRAELAVHFDLNESLEPAGS